MEQQTPTPPPSTPQPPEPPQQPPPSPSPPTPTTTASTASSSAALPPPITATTSTSTSSLPSTTASPPQLSLPSPSQNPQPPTSTPTPNTQTRPAAAAAFNRAWQQPPQPSPISHFALPPPPLPLPPHHHSSSSSASSTASASNSSSSSSSLLVPPPPRGGMAIGVPAHHPGTPPPPPTSFSSLTPPSFVQPFGGLGRNVTDSGPTSSSSQVRPTVGGMQGIGMMGTLGSSSAMRPPGVPVRPVQSSPRPQSSPSIQSPATQNFQGHGMLRVSSVGSPGSPSPGSSQSPQPQNQPWLNSGSQVKPPLPPSRPQVSPQSMQQRSHITQQHHHAMTTTSQQQQASSSQQSQQPSTSGAGTQEHYGQQLPQSRIQQSLPNQQQIARNPSLGTQRPSHSTIPSSPVQPGLPNRAPSAEPEESCNRILSKRSIQELVSHVDASEKLDPEVEDILVDIAEDFVDSITTFGCSLAKHRKSATLEAKDILLHLERNWNTTLPGFSGDEIKTYKKPFTSDIHRERLAVIKKSVLAGETLNSRSSAGQAGGHPKGHLAKGPTSIVGSPPDKRT
nr:transcription initiation factor TFIID subunit 12-like [Coffea arabica]